jgi:hypothetical protein
MPSCSAASFDRQENALRHRPGSGHDRWFGFVLPLGKYLRELGKEGREVGSRGTHDSSDSVLVMTGR